MDAQFFFDNINNPGTILPAIIKEWQPYYQYEAFKNYEPEWHKVNDRAYRPDKIIYEDAPGGLLDELGYPVKRQSVEKVTRIALSIQKTIVDRAAGFLTGGQIGLKHNAEDESTESVLFDRVNSVWKRNKIQFKNGPLVKDLMAQLEIAEIWYSKPTKVADGTDNVDLRVRFYSPANGFDLMPVFDRLGDLIAFGMRYKQVEANTGRTINHYDLYTDAKLIRYSDTGTGFVVDSEVDHNFGKIPVIYWSLPKAPWQDVQSLIDRLEKLMSGFGDTNDYNGSPILFGKGEFNSMPKKGEAGKAIEGLSPESDMKYVTWEGKPEAVIFEKDFLLEQIYSLTQTPNISTDAMQGLGNISGVAFDRIFFDAHLKAMTGQNGWFGEGVQRRLNFLISACSRAMFPKIKEGGLEIVPVFSLYRLNAEYDRVELAMKANGGLPVMSHLDSIAYTGTSEDAQKTLDDITSETEEPDPIQNDPTV